MNKTGSITADVVAVVVIIALAILVIVGCVMGAVKDSSHRIEEGKVADKAYHNAYVSNDFRQSGSTVTPQWTYHPAVYQLQIEGYSADDNKVKCWIVVTPEEYSEYKIGDYFRR